MKTEKIDAQEIQKIREQINNVSGFVNDVNNMNQRDVEECCDSCSSCIRTIANCDDIPKGAGIFWSICTLVSTGAAVATKELIKNSATPTALSGIFLGLCFIRVLLSID